MVGQTASRTHFTQYSSKSLKSLPLQLATARNKHFQKPNFFVLIHYFMY